MDRDRLKLNSSHLDHMDNLSYIECQAYLAKLTKENPELAESVRMEWEMGWEGLDESRLAEQEVDRWDRKTNVLGDSDATTQALHGLLQEQKPAKYRLKPDDVFAGFRVKRKLGRGIGGEVYEVENLLGLWALKLLSSTRKLEQADAENFRHEHLISIKASDIDPETGYAYFTMPLMEQSLQNKLQSSGPQKGLSLEDTLIWMEQIAEALTYLHSKGFIHQDLKPSNILLGPDPFHVDTENSDKVEPKTIAFLCDFGTMGRSDQLQIGGTQYYRSPEQQRAFLFEDKNTPISQSTDVYSFGLVLYVVLTGKQITGPFQLPSEVLKREKSLFGRELDRFLLHCLAEDPAQRLQPGEAFLQAFQRVVRLLDPEREHEEMYLFFKEAVESGDQGIAEATAIAVEYLKDYQRFSTTLKGQFQGLCEQLLVLKMDHCIHHNQPMLPFHGFGEPFKSMVSQDFYIEQLTRYLNRALNEKEMKRAEQINGILRGELQTSYGLSDKRRTLVNQARRRWMWHDLWSKRFVLVGFASVLILLSVLYFRYQGQGREAEKLLSGIQPQTSEAKSLNIDHAVRLANAIESYRLRPYGGTLEAIQNYVSGLCRDLVKASSTDDQKRVLGTGLFLNESEPVLEAKEQTITIESQIKEELFNHLKGEYTDFTSANINKIQELTLSNVDTLGDDHKLIKELNVIKENFNLVQNAIDQRDVFLNDLDRFIADFESAFLKDNVTGMKQAHENIRDIAGAHFVKVPFEFSFFGKVLDFAEQEQEIKMHKAFSNTREAFDVDRADLLTKFKGKVRGFTYWMLEKKVATHRQNIDDIKHLMRKVDALLGTKNGVTKIGFDKAFEEVKAMDNLRQFLIYYNDFKPDNENKDKELKEVLGMYGANRWPIEFRKQAGESREKDRLAEKL